VTLNGRNEAGFLIGSQAERDYLRAVKLGANADEQEAPRLIREEAKRVKAEAKRKIREQDYRLALVLPEWWSDRDTHENGRNRRYLARQKAIRAAFELGVDVPSWVRERTFPTPEECERIREASLARYRETT
jgi:hypothetical protein